MTPQAFKEFLCNYSNETCIADVVEDLRKLDNGPFADIIAFQKHFNVGGMRCIVDAAAALFPDKVLK